MPPQVATKRAGNPSVMEFSMCEKKLEQRSDAGCADVYRDPIHVRKPGPSEEEDAPQEVGILLSRITAVFPSATVVPQ